MIDKAEISNIQSLAEFPSAKAQDWVPVKASFFRRTKRIVGWALMVLVALVLVIFVMLFIALKGGGVSNDQVRHQVETTISSLIGPLHDVDIGDINFSLGSKGALSIIATDMVVTRKATQLAALKVSGLKIIISPLALLAGRVAVRDVILNKTHITIPPKITKSQVVWPKILDVSALLDLTGIRLTKLAQRIENSGLDTIKVNNVEISGFRRFKLSADKATITRLHLIRKSSGIIDVTGQVVVRQARWEIKGRWISKQDENNGMALSISGIEAGDILPSAVRDTRGAIGLDAPVSITFEAPFSKNQVPLDAKLTISVGAGNLRFGRDVHTTITSGELNFRLLPGKNQIELDPSPIVVGNSSATLIGGLRFPKSDVAQHPLFEIIANDVIADADHVEGPPMEGSVLVRGRINMSTRTMHMEEIALTTPEGKLIGAGSVGFVGETPSLALALKIPKISAQSLKQFWPVFIAPAARDWVQKNIQSGTVTNASLDAAIPAGILGRTRQGRKIEPHQLSIKASFGDADFTTTGDFPTVQNGAGSFVFSGMESQVTLSQGFVELDEGGKIQIKSAQLDVGSFQLQPIPAKLKLEVAGSARAVAYFGNRKPLAITSALKVDPAQISGKMSGKVALSFPLEKKITVDSIQWTASLDTVNVGSALPIGGRLFSKANLHIEAKPGLAAITGRAEIDGVAADISLMQPFGEGEIQNSIDQKLKFVLNDAARKKLGIDLKPIVEGSITVSLVRGESGQPQNVIADFTKTKLSLPWVGWSKGKGIKAGAKFAMVTENGVTKISNFNLSGEGFSVLGDLVLDKKGIRSAVFSRVTLNRGDKLRVSIDRTKNGYSIRANGDVYDARAVINGIKSNGQISKVSGKKLDYEVIAILRKVTGFGGEVMNQVKLKLNHQDGELKSLSVVGLGRGKAKTVVSINPDNNITTTVAYSANAGAMLRFLDVYSKIRGGEFNANFTRKDKGLHVGAASVKNFNLVDEQRVQSLLKAPAPTGSFSRSGEIKKIRKLRTNDVPVSIVYTKIIKGEGYMKLRGGYMRGGDVGASFSGNLYNVKGQMDLRGTFLPAYGLNNALSKIPFIGLALGGGTKTGLIGITYRLVGKAKNPKIIVNPMSIMAPGIFRQIFE